LCDLLIQGELRAETINFIEFGWSVVDLVKNKKRKGSLGNFKAVMYGLQDFFKSEKAAITEITSHHQNYVIQTVTAKYQSHFIRVKNSYMDKHGFYLNNFRLRILRFRGLNRLKS